MFRNYDDWKTTNPDDRYLSHEPHPCGECGSDLVDDAHDVTCSYHPDFFEMPAPDYDMEPESL